VEGIFVLSCAENSRERVIREFFSKSAAAAEMLVAVCAGEGQRCISSAEAAEIEVVAGWWAHKDSRNFAKM